MLFHIGEAFRRKKQQKFAQLRLNSNSLPSPTETTTRLRTENKSSLSQTKTHLEFSPSFATFC